MTRCVLHGDPDCARCDWPPIPKPKRRARPERWHVEDVRPGDYIEVQIENKLGDRYLDGVVLRGTVKELVPDYGMVRLDTGWCAHTKDHLLTHRRENQ